MKAFNWRIKSTTRFVLVLENQATGFLGEIARRLSMRAGFWLTKQGRDIL